MKNWKKAGVILAGALTINSVGLAAYQPVQVQTSSDCHTDYIKDYVGRNLADCGYTSWGGQLRDEYGCGTIQLIPVSDDGTFIDVTDKDTMQEYVVTSQNIAPNTEITFTFLKDGDGEEYSNLIDTQSCSEIQLRVKKI